MESYVKAIYNFLNPQAGEIALSVGDVIKVLSKVNDDWLAGSNLTQKAHSGNFPANHVKPLIIPTVGRGQKVFVAVAAFLGDVSGDLPFRKGDIVIGKAAVDNNWWNGELNGNFGIFPLTHVIELSSSPSQLSPVSPSKSKPEALTSNGINSSPSTDKPSTPSAINSGKQNEQLSHETKAAKSKPETSPAVSSSSSTSPVAVLARVRAALALTAQLPEELTFKEGDEIEIVKILDDDFAIGRLNGEIGQLPLAFVDILEGSIKFGQIDHSENEKKLSKFDWWKDPSAEQIIRQKSVDVPYQSQPSFEAQTAPLSSLDDVDDVFGCAGISENDTLTYPNVDTVDKVSSESKCYARSLYPFTSVNANELTFSSDEIIVIVGKVDEEWTEGELNGQRGIFPTSFVEILRDSPVDAGDKTFLNSPSTESQNYATSYNEGSPNISGNTAAACSVYPTSDLTSSISADTRPDANITNALTSNPSSVPSFTKPEVKMTNTVLASDIVNHANIILNKKAAMNKAATIDTPTIEKKEMPVHKIQCENTESSPSENSGGQYSTENKLENVIGSTSDKNLAGLVEEAPLLSATDNNASRDLVVSKMEVRKVNDTTVHCNTDKSHDIPCKHSSQNIARNVTSGSVNQIDATPAGKNNKEVNNSSSVDNETSEVTKAADSTPVSVSTGVDNGCRPRSLEMGGNSSIQKLNPDKQKFVQDLEKKLSGQKPPILKPKPVLKPKPSCAKASLVVENGSSDVLPLVDRNQVTEDEVENKKHEMATDSCVEGRVDSDSLSAETNSMIQAKLPPPRPARKPSINRKPYRASPTSLDHYSTADDDKMVIENSKLEDESKSDETKVTEVSSALRKKNANRPKRCVSFSLPADTDVKLRCVEISETSDCKPPLAQKPPVMNKPAKPKTLGNPMNGLLIGQSQFFTSEEASSTNSTLTSTPIGEVASESQSTFYRHLSDSPSSEAPPSDETQGEGKTKKIPPRPARPRSFSVVPATECSENDGQGKPIPGRPAPPRPPSTRRLSLSDGEALSIENSEEIVGDLQKRIADITKDLEKCNEENESLRVKLLEAEDTEKPDLIESIEFYKANMDGLSDELKALTENLYRLRPDLQAANQRLADEERTRLEKRRRIMAEARQREDQRKKMHETRERAIEELLQTENDYLQSLCLCLETVFCAEAIKCPGCIDLDLLLGNIYEVVELSQKFLSMMEANTAGKSFEDQIMGSCFEELKEELKRVYAIYCRNHNDVTSLLEKYEGIEEAQEYFNAIVNSMRQHATVFDIGSVLIKPVQRIMKYPLMLNQLIKATENSHPDYKHLLSAANAMTDVAQAINEYKRRKDLVLKYKKVGQTSFSDMISRVNVHSTRKKFSRISMKMAGIQTADENFTREEAKFRTLAVCVKVLINDIMQFITTLQECLMSIELLACDVADFYSPDHVPESDQLCKVCKQLLSSSFSLFKAQVDSDVLRPLHSLYQMFQGPSKVIKKRHDKLLDYDSAALRLKSNRESEQTKSLQDEIHKCKMTYQALNAQLLEDLPRFYGLAGQVICDCTHQFLYVQRALYLNVISDMKVFTELPSLVIESSITETFNMRHGEAVDRLSQLSFIPKTFNPLVEEWKIQKSARKSIDASAAAVRPSETKEATVSKQLLEKYGREKLYTLSEDFNGSQLLDLHLPSGTLVGVLKEGDPMGNKHRYYVDAGTQKGFILKSFLVPYNPESNCLTLEPESVELSSPAVEHKTIANKDDMLIRMSELELMDSLNDTGETSGDTKSIEDVASSQESPSAATESFLHPDAQQPEYTENKDNTEYNINTEEREYTENTECSVLMTKDTECTEKQEEEEKEEENTANNERSDDVICSGETDTDGAGPIAETAAVENIESIVETVEISDTRDSMESVDIKQTDESEEIVQDVADTASDGLYEAVYQFEASESSELEIDLEVGEVVKVLQQHDLTGNTDWWLVSVQDGRQGYVPANYLCQSRSS